MQCKNIGSFVSKIDFNLNPSRRLKVEIPLYLYVNLTSVTVKKRHLAK